MNWPTTILGVALAGAAGFFAEPTLRPSLTGEKPVPKKRVVKSDTPAVTDPVSDPAPEPKVDPPAEPVTPPVAVTEPKVDPVPPPAEPTPEPKADPVTPPPAEPAPTPATPVEPKMEEPKQEPAKEEPKEEPKKDPEPVDSSLKLSEEQVVKAMKRSFETGDYKELSAGKPISWKAGPAETIGGESYQTGLLEYSGETIFGIRPIQAKALLKDGVVVKWISPKSGMEIK